MNKELVRTVKYLFIAFSAGLIQIGSFGILNEFFEFHYWVCYLIALVMSVLWNFTFNRRYTFRSANNINKAMMQVFLYYLVFTPASTWLENYLTGPMHWNEYGATILNMLINCVTEYLYQRIVVFGKSIDTNDIARKE